MKPAEGPRGKRESANESVYMNASVRRGAEIGADKKRGIVKILMKQSCDTKTGDGAVLMSDRNEKWTTKSWKQGHWNSYSRRVSWLQNHQSDTVQVCWHYRC